MKYIVYSELDAAQRRALTRRPVSRQNDEIGRQVAAVEQLVHEGGDAALCELSQRFDDVELHPAQLAVDPRHWEQAWDELDTRLQAALRTALHNIAQFHHSELPQRVQEAVETSTGIHCWREFRPIETVGLYIPGGSAPLFSTMLMLGVPAILAGCRQIAFCSPPLNARRGPACVPWAPERGVHAAVEMLGCMELLRQFSRQEAAQDEKSGRGRGNGAPAAQLQYFQVGGAQAIFALAHEREAGCSLPQVAKIFGPGNPYVTEAKLRVSRRVAIDMPAGPSEVLVIAEAGQNAAIVAADLLAQAEHGPSSQVLLASPAAELLRDVKAEVERQTALLPRAHEIAGTLAHSYLLHTRDLAEAIAFSNAYAPEHLILAVDDYGPLLPQIINAGSVFCGPHASESFGDYASGTNHTLPTAGFARSHSGVDTASFGRWLTFQSVSKAGLRQLGPSVELLAEHEQLEAHKNAVTLRLRQLK